MGRRSRQVTLAGWVTDTLTWAQLERAESSFKNYEYALTRLERFLDHGVVTDLRDVTVADLEAYKRHRLTADSRLGIKDASLHTWRHTFTTNLVRSAGDLKAAQEILGLRGYGKRASSGGAGLHRAEFVKSKGLPASANAELSEEDETLHVETNEGPQCEDQQHREP